MNFLSLPRKNIIVFLFCGMGILSIFLITFYSDYLTLDELDKKILELNTKIEIQKLYSPVFRELFRKIQFKLPEGLPFSKQEKVTQEDLPEISTVLQGIALQNNLKIEEISPDVDSLIDGSKHLMISMIIRGELLQLRKFLYQLGGIPYLAHIERLHIQTVEGGKEFRLKVWMAKME